VTVYSKISVQNLTIVCKDTCLNGTTLTSNIDYGTYVPAWGAGVVIESGAIPDALYKIPDDIIRACSTTKVKPDTNVIVFDIQPKCEVLEVYGYT
jgi:hypothetical protein